MASAIHTLPHQQQDPSPLEETFGRLPPEVLTQILEHLPPVDVASLAGSCKTMRTKVIEAVSQNYLPTNRDNPHISRRAIWHAMLKPSLQPFSLQGIQAFLDTIPEAEWANALSWIGYLQNDELDRLWNSFSPKQKEAMKQGQSQIPHILLNRANNLGNPTRILEVLPFTTPKFEHRGLHLKIFNLLSQQGLDAKILENFSLIFPSICFGSAIQTIFRNIIDRKISRTRPPTLLTQ